MLQICRFSYLVLRGPRSYGRFFLQICRFLRCFLFAEPKSLVLYTLKSCRFVDFQFLYSEGQEHIVPFFCRFVESCRFFTFIFSANKCEYRYSLQIFRFLQILQILQIFVDLQIFVNFSRFCSISILVFRGSRSYGRFFLQICRILRCCLFAEPKSLVLYAPKRSRFVDFQFLCFQGPEHIVTFFCRFVES